MTDTTEESTSNDQSNDQQTEMVTTEQDVTADVPSTEERHDSMGNSEEAESNLEPENKEEFEANKSEENEDSEEDDSEEDDSEEDGSEEDDSEEDDSEEDDSEEYDSEEDDSEEDEDASENGEIDENILKLNVHHDLHQLVDLSVKYPEIGPVVLRVAQKLGFSKIANRVVRLGLDNENKNIEFNYVSAQFARDESRYDDVLATVLNAVKKVVEDDKGKNLDGPDKNKLLFLIRLGFSTVMFDFDDVKINSEFGVQMAKYMKELSDIYEGESFFHQLFAQALWFVDEAESEKEWERAVEFGEAEDVWNARGTWYKEAPKNIAAAEAAYRRGLEKTSKSSLLLHNLAQILMDRAEAMMRIDIPQTAVLLNEAEGFLRKSKRFASRRIMRTHVFESFDRLRKLKGQIDQAVKLPEVGDVMTGRVISLKNYGAFIVLPTGHTGLLHSSEIDHYWVEDASTRYNENDAVEVKIIKVEDRQDGEGLRVSLSRKALIEKPADFDPELALPPKKRNKKNNSNNRNNDNRGKEGRSKNRGNRNKRRNDNPSGSTEKQDNRDQKQKNSTTVYSDNTSGATIAEILSAKLNLQGNNKKD